MNRLNGLSQGRRTSDADRTVLVSILSGKGGVGKSVTAFNLAETLASSGRRVLLVDADISTGNIHILANLKSDYGLREFADGRLSLAEAVRPFAPNLDILPSISTGAAAEAGTVSSAVNIARQLRFQGSGYDLVILDHASGISDPATVMASASDLNLLMLVPELTSIADCYGLFKYLKQANSSVTCSLLLNRVEGDEESDYVRSKFLAVADRFLGDVPGFLGYLSEAVALRQSVARQEPVAIVTPDSRIVRDFSALSQKLTDQCLRSRPAGANHKINIHAATADTRG